jgi:hypothetical protein
MLIEMNNHIINCKKGLQIIFDFEVKYNFLGNTYIFDAGEVWEKKYHDDIYYCNKKLNIKIPSKIIESAYDKMIQKKITTMVKKQVSRDDQKRTKMLKSFRFDFSDDDILIRADIAPGVVIFFTKEIDNKVSELLRVDKS